MGLKIITAVATEPVSVAEAKLHLRVDHATEDALIGALITAAREECEHLLERALAPQTLELSIDEFPDDGIKLPHPPVTSITAVEYVDADGVTQTMDALTYYLDNSQEPCWLIPVYSGAWPATRAEANAVTVTYVAGYETCPEAIRAWMLLRIGTLYRHREADSDKPATMSSFVNGLVDRYRVWGL
jgi:uncharacterized phiE125 gp8 family phage protein